MCAAMRWDRHTLLRLAAATLCVVFIVIVLIKGVWILAFFGVAMLALQVINLVLGPRRRRRTQSPPASRSSAADPAAPRSSVADPATRRSAARGRDAARRRARRGRGRG
jgi:hypothetical protein